jgi:hypothetical protein
MPLIAVIQGAGLGLLAFLAHRTSPAQAVAPTGARRRLRALFAPIMHMHDILRRDRMFLRYEQAFMTYGVGWMICHALLPVLVTAKLAMSYQEIAHSTQVVFQSAMLLMVYPMGWLIDRLGAARSSALSFAGLACYPLGLALAGDPFEIALASGAYGVCMAGVQHGWMLGPVALAPGPQHVAQYVAIHTTLVGLRGILAQGLGMALYRATHSFTWPLAIAAAAFVWAAWQMRRLQRSLRLRARVALAGGEPEPAAEPMVVAESS